LAPRNASDHALRNAVDSRCASTASATGYDFAKAVSLLLRQASVAILLATLVNAVQLPMLGILLPRYPF
jgi:hypothetical protein